MSAFNRKTLFIEVWLQNKVGHRQLSIWNVYIDISTLLQTLWVFSNFGRNPGQQANTFCRAKLSPVFLDLHENMLKIILSWILQTRVKIHDETWCKTIGEFFHFSLTLISTDQSVEVSTASHIIFEAHIERKVIYIHKYWVMLREKYNF